MAASQAESRAGDTPAEIKFAISSVRVNLSGAGSSISSYTPDGFRANNVELVTLIRQAYQLPAAIDGQVSQLPGWAGTERFDIEAKVDPADVARYQQLGPERRALVLRQLLRERFGLICRQEKVAASVLALVLARNGAVLREATPGDTYQNGIKVPAGGSGAGSMMVQRGKVVGQAIPISRLVPVLMNELGAVVVDKTGLTGRYDISLQWTPERNHGANLPASPMDASPSIYTALREQLGLTLRSEQGFMDRVVVEHLERPGSN